jgi:hypothetical protein
MIERKPYSAFWRSLHTQGHDSALLAPALGWTLTGMAAFWLREGPVAVNYSVEVDEDWITRRGSIRGFVGSRRFYHSIERTADGWKLDGKPNGMAELVDLDFGFTPATNVFQVQRAGLEIGERAEFSVVWFDIGRQTLVELPQIYERRDLTHYWYESPTADGFEAMLEVDRHSGFARDYPTLWKMEDAAMMRSAQEFDDEDEMPNAFSTSSAA